MYHIPDDTLDRWLREDAPYLDLTTHTLGLGPEAARIAFHTRQPVVVCGTEEAARILAAAGGGGSLEFRVSSLELYQAALSSPELQTLNAKLDFALPSGATAAPGDLLLAATGPAGALHIAWKVCANILEHASGIATRTRQLVETARAAAPSGRHISVAATRKGFPGTRELAIKAVLAGGGVPHRLGLSETLLVFAQHRAFFPSDTVFASKIPELKARACEKKFIVEADTPEEARRWADAGADGVQFDKLPPPALAEAVAALRAAHPGLLILAAGGINAANAAAHAATGVDALVTSSMFSAPPADIRVTIQPLPGTSHA
ncbi:putative molybdenum utilization protein ModD [Opitutaceae bacterium TAV1]|nr:putative molybdenum utilization protein ModD [Opitutaceae bacterium TAV1]